MSPEKAKIFFVEDNQFVLRSKTFLLQRAGHQVVLTASSRQEVTEKNPSLKDAGVQVALVDGNLSEGDDSGDDGEAVAREIKKHNPDVIVIGHALRKPIASADINCPKVESPEKLLDTITKA